MQENWPGKLNLNLDEIAVRILDTSEKIKHLERELDFLRSCRAILTYELKKKDEK